LNLCDLVALSPGEMGRLPVIAYFHESRLPGRGDGPSDGGYGFTQIMTCLAARQVWFNSQFHREQFLSRAEATLTRAPDYVPAGLIESIRTRSRVMPPGTDLRPLVAGQKKDRPGTGPLTILWSHRWEEDKNPQEFFGVLFLLADEGYSFRLSVIGETLRKWPPVFEQARKRLGNRIVRFGYLPDRADYIQTVRQADVVVSTAIQEFFGLPVVEAIAAGLYPLLPNRLSYPEIVPPRWHKEFLYRDQRGLRSRLMRLLCGSPADNGTLRASEGEGSVDWAPARQLARHIQSYDWLNLIKKYDDALEEVAGGHSP